MFPFRQLGCRHSFSSCCSHFDIMWPSWGLTKSHLTSYQKSFAFIPNKLFEMQRWTTWFHDIDIVVAWTLNSCRFHPKVKQPELLLGRTYTRAEKTSFRLPHVQIQRPIVMKLSHVDSPVKNQALAPELNWITPPLPTLMTAISFANGADGKACHITVAAVVTGWHICDTMWEMSEQTKSTEKVDKVSNKKTGEGSERLEWTGQDSFSGKDRGDGHAIAIAKVASVTPEKQLLHIRSMTQLSKSIKMKNVSKSICGASGGQKSPGKQRLKKRKKIKLSREE